MLKIECLVKEKQAKNVNIEKNCFTFDVKHME